MGQDSAIEWTHHTFNPWRGCTKVSPGCAHCYAETLSRRNPSVLGIWGDKGTRVPAAESYWRQPLAWDKAAEAAGERHRVFCASLADVFEDRLELRPWRLRLMGLIERTPHLDWLLLTKRPENVMPAVERAALDCTRPNDTCDMLNAWLKGSPPANVWLGTSVEDQERANQRIPHLLRAPAAVRFLSAEPLLGPVDLGSVTLPNGDSLDATTGEICAAGAGCLVDEELPPVDWVIVGGESGPGARPCHLDWVRSLVSQCKTSGVACFVKQLGAHVIDPDYEEGQDAGPARLILPDRKGGNPDQWPDDLRVRQFPQTEHEAPHA